jgi:hypothetical protein
MAIITLRTASPGPLTNAQVDANFSNLNTEKIERNGSIPMTGKLTLDTPISTNASVNFPVGVNPTSLVAGDVWNSSNSLKFYNGTASLQLSTLTGVETLTSKTLITPVIAEIDNSAAITLDAATDINLDADSGDIYLKDNGVIYGVLNNNTGSLGDLVLKSGVNNALVFTTTAPSTIPNALFYGGIKGSHFSTSAPLTGGPAYPSSVSVGSTTIFGSWGGETSDNNMDFKGGLSHNIALNNSGNFEMIGDTANNGGSMILTSGTGNNIEFYVIGSTGGTTQTVTAANMFANHRKMIIDSSGRLTVYGTGHIAGQGFAVGTALTPSTIDGRIDAAGDVVAFSTSDFRLKENIVNIPDALNKVLNINGVTFNWKSEFQQIHGFIGADVGLIAQEVEAILPLAVRDRWDGYKAVRYDKMIALLIEAIKELNVKIESMNG